jgi:SAM-dependent methyltransferase
VDRVRESYDAVARQYGEHLAGELAGKPVDRAVYALFAELCGDGRVGDVGCGPGHVTAHLASLGLDAVGVDLSPGMVDEARRRFPERSFRVGSMIEPGGLGEPDGVWAGAVAAYAIVHLDHDQRRAAYAELHRAIESGGWLLLSFHIEDAEHRPGDVKRFDEWWGSPVELTFHFIDPVEVIADLGAAGFEVVTRTDRVSWPDEAPTRRCHLIARTL